MKLRALRALKREAKSAFIFVLERGAPFHRALAGPSNPAGSGRRQRVAVVCWRKQTRRLQHTDPPPCWTGRGALGAQNAKLPQDPHISPSIRPTVIELNELICMS